MTDDKPRPVLSPLFWAAMVFCLVCFAGAGYVVMTALHPSPLASPAARATHLGLRPP